jgi:hypothetical protein
MFGVSVVEIRTTGDKVYRISKIYWPKKRIDHTDCNFGRVDDRNRVSGS